MPSEFKVTRPVEFAETDMAGIVHFTNFFRYMEACEAAFFRSLGLELIQADGGVRSGWPRARANCEYHEPLRFGDTVEIHLYVKEIKLRSLHYLFRFRKLLPGGGETLVASGELLVVCAALEASGRLASRDIPAEVRAKVQVALPEVWKQ